MNAAYTYDPVTGRFSDHDPALPLDRPLPEPPVRRMDANPAAAHDAEHGAPREWPPLPRVWVPERFAPSEPLTDAIIAKRKAEGYFSDEYHEAVRRTAAKKADAAAKRNND